MREQFETASMTNIELIPSSGGVFEITVNGELKFSKKALGRFPTDEEVNAILQSG